MTPDPAKGKCQTCDDKGYLPDHDHPSSKAVWVCGCEVGQRIEDYILVEAKATVVRLETARERRLRRTHKEEETHD